MSDIIIHHYKIIYDEGEERVRNYVKYLKAFSNEEELTKYYEECLKDKNGRVYIEDKMGNEFTFICSKGHNCYLYLRGMEK